MYDEETPIHGSKLVSFILAGFLIASVVLFSVTVIPEVAPSVFPAFKTGTVRMQLSVAPFPSSGVFLDGMGLFVTIESVELHRLGLAGGISVQALSRPAVVESVPIYNTPIFFGEADVPIGDYSFVNIRFGPTSYLVADLNVTTQVPARDIVVPATFGVSEGKTTTLTINVSFDPYALIRDQRFQPTVLITAVEPSPPLEPGKAPRPIASSGPVRLRPGENMTLAFEIKPGEEVDYYLLEVQGSPEMNETVSVEVRETGESWTDLSGTVWLLGGNLTAGVYHVVADMNSDAKTPGITTVSIFGVPQVTGTGSPASFSGYSRSTSLVGVNEVAVNFDEGGTYKFYLLLGQGNYGFFVDNGFIATVSRNQTVTLPIEKGLHTIQIVPDYLDLKANTAWTVAVVAAASGTGGSLTASSVLGIVLLVAAILMIVVRFSYERLLARRKHMIASQTRTLRAGRCG